MSKRPVYKYDNETFEYKEVIPKRRILKGILKGVAFAAAIFGYYYIYTDVLHLESPETMFLRKNNEELQANMLILNSELQQRRQQLEELQLRDNKLYRPLFGMDEIPEDIRRAGYGGVDRYSEYSVYIAGNLMKSVASEIDGLYSMAYVQSRSLDEIHLSALKYDELAASMPTISPVVTDGSCRFSSSFGIRRDPWTGQSKRHDGIDISGKAETPIYATGDGIVEKVAFDIAGYGRYVIINHGFGYKTRYGHLHSAAVSEGQRVKRGEIIAGMGNTGGRSKGTHLHYEVIYKGRPVNPLNYFSMSMDSNLYRAMVETGDTI